MMWLILDVAYHVGVGPAVTVSIAAYGASEMADMLMATIRDRIAKSRTTAPPPPPLKQQPPQPPPAVTAVTVGPWRSTGWEKKHTGGMRGRRKATAVGSARQTEASTP